MMNLESEKLLLEADQAAEVEDWQSASEILMTVLEGNPSDPTALTGMGITNLHLENFVSAAEYFQEAAQLQPDSAEAFNNLGVAHALQCSFPEAEEAYQRALEIEPNNQQAWKNLADIYLQQDDRLTEGVQILAAVIQHSPDDTEAVGMLASCYHQAGDFEMAIYLYEQILALEPDNLYASNQVEQLSALQERKKRIAQPEHIQKLAALANLSAGSEKNTVKPKQVEKKYAVGFYGPHQFAFKRRMTIPAKAFSADKNDIKISSQFQQEDIDRYDYFVFSRPHANDELFEAALQCLEAGKKTIVDLDLNFAKLTEDHPRFDELGPGNSDALQRLGALIQSPAAITVPNQHLARELGLPADRVTAIPTGWLKSDQGWTALPTERPTINLGLFSTHVNPSFGKEIQDQITTALNDSPQALLVAVGDYELLAQFPGVQEDKKMFIPLGAFENYPYTFSHIDILLVPEKEGSADQRGDDLPLLEAGLRRAPWIASPNPAFSEWGEGGILAAETEWAAAILDLIGSPVRREELGRDGNLKAQEREGSKILESWKSLFEGMK